MPPQWSLANSSIHAFLVPNTIADIDFTGARGDQPPTPSSEIRNMPWTVSDGATPPASVPKFSQINDPAVPIPSDASLGFDAYGLNDWPTFLMHPVDVLKANELGKQAVAVTYNLYPDDPGGRHNDAPDAFRHAYWNYTMTQAFGPDEARAFGDAHEILVPNPAGERYMDLYNSQVGRGLAATGQGAPIDVIKSAVAQGYTRNSPFK
jgi:hypothetical protein